MERLHLSTREKTVTYIFKTMADSRGLTLHGDDGVYSRRGDDGDYLQWMFSKVIDGRRIYGAISLDLHILERPVEILRDVLLREFEAVARSIENYNPKNDPAPLFKSRLEKKKGHTLSDAAPTHNELGEIVP